MEIAWVAGLLETGIVTLSRVKELHQINPIPEEDQTKIEDSFAEVMALLSKRQS